MTVFATSLGILLAALAAHLVWWRIRLPRRQTRAIILITLGAWLAGVSIVRWEAGAEGFSAVQMLHVALVVVSVLGAYIISYSALEADSPTLVMMLLLDKAGQEGMDEAEFLASLDDSVLILPRLDDLVRDGMASVDTCGRFRLRPKGLALLRLIEIHRSILRRGAGG
jgi:hypothetical protein